MSQTLHYSMKPRRDLTLTVAEIVYDSAAMNEAALARDFDEARLRAQLVIAKADAAGLEDVILAGATMLDRRLALWAPLHGRTMARRFSA